MTYWKNTAHSLITVDNENNSNKFPGCFYYITVALYGYVGKNGNHGNNGNHGAL
jgi:hypothetical protein